MVKTVIRHAVNQVKGRQHIKTASISSNQGNREDNAQRTALQRRLDIIRRTSVASAGCVALLINLCQRALNKSRCAAHNRDQPHPEHRAVTADGDRIGYTYDIACADAARRRYHQRLKCGYGVAVCLFSDYPD